MKVARMVHSTGKPVRPRQNSRLQDFLHARFSYFPAQLEFKDRGLAFDIGFREILGVWSEVFQFKAALDIKANKNELNVDEMAEVVFGHFAPGLADHLTSAQEAELSIHPQNIYAPILMEQGTVSEEDIPPNRLLLTVIVRPKG